MAFFEQLGFEEEFMCAANSENYDYKHKNCKAIHLLGLGSVPLKFINSALNNYEVSRRCTFTYKDTMKRLLPHDFTCMDVFEQTHPLRVELAYARDDNLLFGERIYRTDAALWLYTGLADIVLEASRLCYARHGLRFVLHDGLRTADAQRAMLHTQRVKDNPHWLTPPCLLSSEGSGGHPRGMAIDISAEDAQGRFIDMGCPFDFLADNPTAAHNPAHRHYAHTSDIVANREKLDTAMMDAAQNLNTPLIPLTEEWWDFRLPASFSSQFAPLYDADLPPAMRMLEA